MKIVSIIGARPQFVKAAAVSRAIAARGSIRDVIIHTGQHFDDNMSEVFFRELDIPKPDHHLGVGACGHGAMTGRMLEAIEPILQAEEPDWVLVYGDTNSTLAGALAAAKLTLPLAHVEAGLRSGDRRMPEETNRIVADHVSDLLFAPTDAAVANLTREGIDERRIIRTGDVMFDAFLHDRDRARTTSTIRADLGLNTGPYVLATVHRAASTDDATSLRGIMDGLQRVAASTPVIFPVHPRTRAALARAKVDPSAISGLRAIDPVGYLDMLALEEGAAMIVTDSGGVQKEAYFHGVPCLTLRDETEWIELVTIGANCLVGADPKAIGAGFDEMKGRKPSASDLYGDGRAAERMVEALMAASPGIA